MLAPRRLTTERRKASADRVTCDHKGLEFKQQLPELKDSDTSMDRHAKEFQCHAFGRKGVRPVDVLHLFRKALAVGGKRLNVYRTYLRKAWKDGLMPHDAQAVYEGVLTKLRSVVREAALQWQGRVEKPSTHVSLDLLGGVGAPLGGDGGRRD